MRLVPWHLSACAALALLATCVSLPLAPPPASAPAARARTPAPTERRATAPLPRAPNAPPCPVRFDDADVVLARVGDVVLTACDVAVAQQRALREGRTPTPERTLEELVNDALLADEAARRGLGADRETARRTRETLAAAVVHADALEIAAASEPDDDAIAEFYAAHHDEFTTDERARLREIVLPDEASARAVLRELAAGAPFETLVRERTVSAEGARDEGELGLVPRGGNDRVPREVADAGWALGETGGTAASPVRVETTELVGRRRRRTRRVVRFHVVQSLGVVPATTPPLAEIARTIRHRASQARYQQARAEVRARLLEALRVTHPPDVDERALRAVRLVPPPPAPLPERRRRDTRTRH